MRALGGQPWVVLAEGRDVVEDPHGAAMGTTHQVVVFDDEIINRTNGQVELEQFPTVAAIERHVEIGFGAGKQQAFAHGVFTDNPYEMVASNPADNPRPGHTTVGGAIDVGCVVVEFVTGGREGDGVGVVGRYFNRRHHGPFGHVGRRDVLP
jgi:hypothetical protein